MRDWLFLVLGLCAIVISVTLTVDLTMQARYRLRGGPSTQRMWEHMLAKSEETIKTQARTIKTQAMTIQQLKQQLQKLNVEDEESEG